MADDRFDIIVIGGGGAGYAAASTAARLGRRVAMVEAAKLGGTCLNRGCVPTKTLVRTARVLETLRGAAELGIDVGPIRLDYSAVQARRAAVIRGFSGDGPLESLAQQGISLLTGWARFVDPHTVAIGDRLYAADRFVICSGSEAVTPEIPGLSEISYLTSDEALELPELPETVAIVGGGIIGCEFASLWAAYGVQVTIVARRLLSNEDEEVSRVLLEAFERRGIRHARGRAVGMRASGDRKLVILESPDGRQESLLVDEVLVATGRKARFEDLNLEAAGVETQQSGIPVDDAMRTSAPHIWVGGDVIGHDMYTHSGDHGAEVAGWNAAGGEPARRADFRVVPRPVFSIPEVASVGLTEAQARQAGYDVEAPSVCVRDISKAVIDNETEGFCKIVADRATGEILGGTIVAADAATLIAPLAVAMSGRVSAYVLGDTLQGYPTMPELVRWTADQVGKHLEPGEQARRAAGAPLHPGPMGSWPERGSAARAREHLAAVYPE